MVRTCERVPTGGGPLVRLRTPAGVLWQLKQNHNTGAGWLVCFVTIVLLPVAARCLALGLVVYKLCFLVQRKLWVRTVGSIMDGGPGCGLGPQLGSTGFVLCWKLIHRNWIVGYFENYRLQVKRCSRSVWTLRLPQITTI